MRNLKRGTIFICGFLAAYLLIVAPGGATGEVSLGEKLERGIWADIKEGDWKAVESKIAPGFQSVHQDGARDRETEIRLIKGLNLGEYTLSNFKVTRKGAVLIVTYFVSAGETIKNKRLSVKPAPRLSAWMETDRGWQWVCHANLKPLK